MKMEERTTQTEQEERIAQMELLMERASEAVMQLSAALDIMEEAQPGIAALDDYYGSQTWRQDFDDDASGLLPANLKRGVLSEDGIWNLLSDYRELMGRLQQTAAVALGE